MESIAVHIGFDPGKRRDPGAIVVSDVQQREQIHYVVRHIEKIPLGTDHIVAIDRVIEINDSLKTMGHDPQMFVDVGGIGEVVLDVMRNRGVFPMAVYLVNSDKATLSIDSQASKRWGKEIFRLSLGKAVLTSRLQVLFESNRLHLPETQAADDLVDELLTFEATFSKAGNAKFEGKTGKHDDLVIALGLSVWHEPTVNRKPKYRQRVRGKMIAGTKTHDHSGPFDNSFGSMLKRIVRG